MADPVTAGIDLTWNVPMSASVDHSRGRAVPADPAPQTTRWAVAVTLAKNIPTGLNVQTAMYLVTARSQAEAKGLAADKAKSECPEHMIHTIASMEIPDA